MSQSAGRDMHMLVTRGEVCQVLGVGVVVLGFSCC
jgi:hypothetical protein